jgi:hypothetical protein
MDEFGIRPLCPTPRRLVKLAGKDAHGNRDGGVLEVEKWKFVFPIERDVVKHVVSCKFGPGIVQVEGGLMAAVIAAAGCASPSPWSISQAARPTGESAIPYSVCGRVAISYA